MLGRGFLTADDAAGGRVTDGGVEDGLATELDGLRLAQLPAVPAVEDAVGEERTAAARHHLADRPHPFAVHVEQGRALRGSHRKGL